VRYYNRLNSRRATEPCLIKSYAPRAELSRAQLCRPNPRPEAPHQKAFGRYFAFLANENGLRGLVTGQQKANEHRSGGPMALMLVDPETSSVSKSVLTSGASVRAIANVVQVEATSYDVLVDHSDIGQWPGPRKPAVRWKTGTR